jgi:nascent polypeptide-associated complex subunit beta
MSDAVKEARKAMIAKRFGGNSAGAATGGAGSQRMKAKAKSGGSGEAAKISAALKKFQFNEMKNLMEVNIFKGDDVIHITEPKIQAAIACNTFQVTGKAETKPMTDYLPDILNQLGPESMERLRKYAETLSGGSGAAAAGGASIPEGAEEDSDDEDVPDLVDNFDEATD